jgi:NAD+ diphosphatase
MIAFSYLHLRRRTWKIYSGTPYFAVDVTPKGSEEQQTAAKDVIGAMDHSS